MNFLRKHQAAFFKLSLCLWAVSFCFYASGCAGAATVLQEIISAAGVLAASVSSVLAAIGVATNNPELSLVATAVTTWTQKVVAGLQNIEALLQQYKTSPNETLLQKIEDAIALGISDVNSFAQIEGIPMALASQLTAWGQLVLSQIQAWAAVVAGWKTATTTTANAATVAEVAAPIHSMAMFRAAMTPVQANQMSHMLTARELESRLKAILGTA